MDWLSQLFTQIRNRVVRHGSRRELELWRDSSMSLAKSVDELCGLCDDLLEMIPNADRKMASLGMQDLGIRIHTVRNHARQVGNSRSARHGSLDFIASSDPYSLRALSAMVTHDDSHL